MVFPPLLSSIHCLFIALPFNHVSLVPRDDFNLGLVFYWLWSPAAFTGLDLNVAVCCVLGGEAAQHAGSKRGSERTWGFGPYIHHPRDCGELWDLRQATRPLGACVRVCNVRVFTASDPRARSRATIREVLAASRHLFSAWIACATRTGPQPRGCPWARTRLAGTEPSVKEAGGRVGTGDAPRSPARPRLQRQLAGPSLGDARPLGRPGSSSSRPHWKHAPCFPGVRLARSSHSTPHVSSRPGGPLLPRCPLQGPHASPAHFPPQAGSPVGLFCAPVIRLPSPA